VYADDDDDDDGAVTDTCSTCTFSSDSRILRVGQPKAETHAGNTTALAVLGSSCERYEDAYLKYYGD